MGFDPESRQRPLALAGAALAAGGLYAGGFALAAGALGVVMLLTACVSARDGFLLLGPFATVEARRLARRDRVHLRRVLLLLGVGFVVYVALGTRGEVDTGDPYARARFRAASTTLTSGFAITFTLTVAALSVVGVAGVVAEERAAKRWDVLLATDLRPREIVFGKVVSRAVGVLALAAAALPVVILLSVPRLVPREAILPGAAFLAGAALALAGLAARFSASLRAPEAVSATGAAAILYLAGSSALCGLRASWPAGWANPIVYELVALVNAANPITTVQFALNWGPATDEAFLATLPDAARRFVAGSLAMFLWGTLGACRNLRAIDDRPRRTPAQRLGALAGKLLRLLGLLRRPRGTTRQRGVERPGVTDDSLAWWVAYQTPPISRRLAGPPTARGLAILFGLALTGFGLCRAVEVAADPLGVRRGGGYATDFALFVVHATLLTAPIGVLAALARTARAIPEQRAADTYESLRLTALTPLDVVRQVRAGALAGTRRQTPRVALVMLAAVLTGFAPWPTVLLGLILLWALPPAFASWVILLACRESTPGSGVRLGLVGGLALHALVAVGVTVPTIFVWHEAYIDLIGGNRIPLVSEFLWWDWMIGPESVGRTLGSNGYRTVGPIEAGRLVWPLGPAVGAGVLALIVAGYVRLSRFALKVAAVHLAGVWYAVPTRPPGR